MTITRKMNKEYNVDTCMAPFTRALALDTCDGECVSMSDVPLGLSGEFVFRYTYPKRASVKHEVQPFMSAIDLALFVAADCKALFAARDDLYFEGYKVNIETRVVAAEITA